ncbi:hypothetical protein G6F70_008029 [Rhizopus microsporus]|uniref:C2H2-type domain-containing protein n=2 Tax=Rhizopus TaxID=4842 RepID=A0A367J6U7_RHIAZ|nr:hypothetical protein G6F71_008016 [Rhizopus microsporus]RCH85653.1 hypothetical protein CU097_005398 [Rhizopus azygosporus]KAG1195702.1 hypothetical protein G6F70_008029 [Rhizopus microsporus]KAG1207554.1 hypothetical protein G6F69_007945 [Rhizopus microsporus]KAG1228383.1 hypothetical protein G6F67_007849 [Rhizopus microsporus]
MAHFNLSSDYTSIQDAYFENDFELNLDQDLTDPPISLQVTLSTEPDPAMLESEYTSSATPIDIPKSQSYLNMPAYDSNYEAFLSSALSTSYTSSINAPDFASYNSLSNLRSPLIATDDLTSWFDALAVRSPSGSIYSNPIHSPLQIGSPQSPLCFSGASSPNNFLAGSSPCSSQFLGSPLLHDPQALNYLSPTLRPTLLRSTSPLSSPRLGPQFLPLHPSTLSPRPNKTTDDVILTATELNDFTASPYLTAVPDEEAPVTTADGFDEISDLLFGNVHMDDLELFPPAVSPSAPHTQPQPASSDIKKPKRKTVATTKRGKIHKCPYCDHTSNRANNMREHTQIHNPNRPKPFCCKICKRAFARKHDMKRHYLSCKKHLSKLQAISV